MRQVNKDHYEFSAYSDKFRWMSYWYQIDEVLKINPKRVLLVGIGDGIVPAVLQKCLDDINGMVLTFDFDESLNPDFLGDIRDISNIVQGQKFDCILCCQLLEHLEYKYFDQILKPLSST